MSIEFCYNFPLFSIVLTLICSVITSVLPKKPARILTLCLCLTDCLLSAVLTVVLLSSGTSVTFPMGHFPHPWGNEIRFGALESFFVAVFSLIEFLSILGGKDHLERDLESSKQNLYYVMADLVLVALVSLCYTNDLFTGYVFIEICTIASCGLLMIRQLGRTTLASVRYMIFSLIGSGLFLLGVIFLYGITGHLLMPNLLESVRSVAEEGTYRLPLLTSAVLMMTGLAVKSGLFPFHFWMPDTYGAATVSSSSILSGLVSKGYIFLLLKIVFRVFGTEFLYSTGLQNILFILGIFGIVIGSVEAIREKDVFRMLACSSAAQIGYIYMAAGISPDLGIIAALFHMLSHSITKPMLFLTAACLEDVSGGRTLDSLKGSAHRSPFAGFVFSVAAFSMVGIPATMGFVCKYYHAAAALASSPVRTVAALTALAVSTGLNAVYFGRSVIAMYLPDSETSGELPKASRSFTVASAVLCAANLFCGLLPHFLRKLLETGLSLF